MISRALAAMAHSVRPAPMDEKLPDRFTTRLAPAEPGDTVWPRIRPMRDLQLPSCDQGHERAGSWTAIVRLR